MKKLTRFCMGALIATGATMMLTACASDDTLAENPTEPVNPTEQTFTMTVEAARGEDNALARALAAAGMTDGTTNRALKLDNETKTLTGTWTKGDAVKVLGIDEEKMAIETVGTLYAQSDGTATTLDGTLDKTPQRFLIDPDDNEYSPLILIYPRYPYDYTGQKGTLADIAANYDYNTYYADEWTEKDGKISIPGTAAFYNTSQSIIRFTLKDKAGKAIKVKNLTLHDDNNRILTSVDFTETDYVQDDLTVNLDEASSEVWVALCATDKVNLTLTADGEDGHQYTFTRNEVLFDLGKFYTISVKMNKIVDLSKLKGNYEAQDGEVLTGTLGGNYKVSVADGAKVTLRNVTINGTNNSSYDWAGLTCDGDAEITLEGTNTLRGFYKTQPGLFIAENKTLTIKGNGSLTASPFDGGTNNSWAAGIGGGHGIKCGNIVIEGGTITANGGYWAAGIGGGPSTPGCGSITIKNTVTKVTATSNNNDNSTTIGFGYPGSCGTVTIGGTVYWDYNATTEKYEFKNGGETYLRKNPLVYEP